MKIPTWLQLTEPRATVIVGVLGLIVAAVTYSLTERARLEQESYSRREDRYTTLLESAAAFHVSATVDVGTRGQFLKELQLCWLYCPDEVLRAGYTFVDAVETGSTSTPVERARAMQALVIAIRQDLLTRSRPDESTMRAEEYQILTVNSAATQ
jgi:hypothetical protein